MKTIIVLIVLLKMIVSITFCQVKQEISFFGVNYQLYQRPVRITGNYYEAYFENMGRILIEGRIILDETIKTFTIKYIDGNDWICKYAKKEIKNDIDPVLGDVVKTIYTGKFMVSNSDCMLVIVKTKSSGCLTVLKTRKVVDTNYGIDTWKKIYTFCTSGKCFE